MLETITGGGQGSKNIQEGYAELEREGMKHTVNIYCLAPLHNGECFKRCHTLNQY
jgi:hypothetical protein